MGFRCNLEAEMVKARFETCYPEHAQRVFGKCAGNVAQLFRSNIGLATIGVDQFTARCLCNRVDGQVAALQVFFQGDLGVEPTDESGVGGDESAVVA